MSTIRNLGIKRFSNRWDGLQTAVLKVTQDKKDEDFICDVCWRTLGKTYYRLIDPRSEEYYDCNWCAKCYGTLEEKEEEK